MPLASDVPSTSGCCDRRRLAQQRVHEHRGQDDRHAEVEQRRQLALLAQQHDRQHDRVDRFQVGRPAARRTRSGGAAPPATARTAAACSPAPAPAAAQVVRAGQHQQRRRRRRGTAAASPVRAAVSSQRAGAQFKRRSSGQRVARAVDQALVRAIRTAPRTAPTARRPRCRCACRRGIAADHQRHARQHREPEREVARRERTPRQLRLDHAVNTGASAMQVAATDALASLIAP